MADKQFVADSAALLDIYKRAALLKARSRLWPSHAIFQGAQTAVRARQGRYGFPLSRS